MNVAGSGIHLRRTSTSSQHLKYIDATSNVPNIVEAIRKTSLDDNVKNAELIFSSYIFQGNLPFRIMDTLPKVCAKAFGDSDS